MKIMPRRSKKAKPPLKKVLALIWGAVSIAWIVYAANITNLGDAYRVFQTYDRYQYRIEQRFATDYEKHRFLAMTREMDGAGERFMSFFLMAFGLPALVLAAGTWLMRTKD